MAYLGIPIVDAPGAVLGSFCLVDHRPRGWTEAHVAIMEELTAEVIAELRSGVLPSVRDGEDGR